MPSNISDDRVQLDIIARGLWSETHADQGAEPAEENQLAKQTREMGPAYAAFYREMLAAGMGPRTAARMTQNYMSLHWEAVMHSMASCGEED